MIFVLAMLIMLFRFDNQAKSIIFVIKILINNSQL